MNKQVNVMLLLMVGFEEEEARNLYTVFTESVECRRFNDLRNQPASRRAQRAATF